jgi:hypothetical protein
MNTSMNSNSFRSFALATIISLPLLSAATATAKDWLAGFQEGKPALQSAGQLAFGPEGILFLADSKGAAIVAVSTGDTKAPAASAASAPLKLERINEQIAALLGTKPEEILIEDLAVNPLSHVPYMTVSRGRGPSATPVVLRINPKKELEVVSLEKVKYSRAELPDAPIDGVVGDVKRQSNPRMESITDIAFLNDRVLIAGLSNEEFSSTLRAIAFPFEKIPGGTSVEMYHGAHGRFETKSPIRTFVPFMVGNEPSVLAAYTCTPLVQFPIKQLEPGAKVKGKTIAELGNRNRPLDLIVYEKDGKQFLLLANSARGVMKVSTENIETADGILEPVKGGGSKGLTYETVEGWTGVTQLTQLDPKTALVLRGADAAAASLEALPLP